MGFPGGTVVKNLRASAGDTRDTCFVPGLGRNNGNGNIGTIANGNLVFLPGKFHGQRSLALHSLWGHKELDTTALPPYTYTYTHMQALTLLLVKSSFIHTQSLQ